MEECNIPITAETFFNYLQKLKLQAGESACAMRFFFLDRIKGKGEIRAAGVNCYVNVRKQPRSEQWRSFFKLLNYERMNELLNNLVEKLEIRIDLCSLFKTKD